VLTVSTFATSNGFTVVRSYTSQALLTVSGTVSAIESAFFVTLNLYQRPDGSTFYAPANAPSANLSVGSLRGRPETRRKIWDRKYSFNAFA
jgi:subtilase family serine protease